MHGLSKSWAATLLMGVLGMSFVVWGIADVFTGGSSNAVATIGHTEINQFEFQRVYRNFVRNQGQQMGTEVTPEMAQKMGLPRWRCSSLSAAPPSTMKRRGWAWSRRTPRWRRMCAPWRRSAG